MADFQTSSHRAKWVFSKIELVEKYKSSNHRAVQQLKKHGLPETEGAIDATLPYPEPLKKSKGERHSRTKPLKIEEEKLLRVFYQGKIQEVCLAFKFPNKIQATALIYFKRFYLHWSVMEYHPKHIMLTCIYAACKIEESHVSAEELGKGIEQDHQMILNNEMILYQTLEFDLIVYAPYRALQGFVTDMKDFFQESDLHPQLLKDLDEVAEKEVHDIMLTDAPLLYPPGQLAIEALRRSNKVHKFIDFESYLRSISSRHPMKSISGLNACLDAIDNLVSEFKVPLTADMKHIDRKLKSCHNQEGKKREKKSNKNHNLNKSMAADEDLSNMH